MPNEGYVAVSAMLGGIMPWWGVIALAAVIVAWLLLWDGLRATTNKMGIRDEDRREGIIAGG